MDLCVQQAGRQTGGSRHTSRWVTAEECSRAGRASQASGETEAAVLHLQTVPVYSTAL